MKRSILTFILLLTTSAAAVLAEEPEGEVKRYKVVLDNKMSVAEIKKEMVFEEPADLAVQETGEKTTDEPEETEPASVIDPQRPEEPSRKWWKPWDGNDSEASSKDKPPADIATPARDEGRKWWKPWGQADAPPEKTEESLEAAEGESGQKKRSWWKPWSQPETDTENSGERPKATEEETRQDGKKWWKPWGKKKAAPEEPKPVEEQPEPKTGKWWNPLD